MLTSDVENFPGFPESILGPELMEQMRKQAERFDPEIIYDDASKVNFKLKPFEITVGKRILQGKTVIISTGANAKWLGIPSETKLRGHGVSSCATCDGYFFKEKEVLVVGGGDTALKSRNLKTGKEHVLKTDGVFVAIGYEPNTAIFKGQVDLDPKGYIVTHNETETNVPGIFAAGDVRDFRYRQAVTAAADGCKAAIDADRFIGEH